MTSILCLAHYCDTHGPTPLMVTEGFSVSCTYCHDEDKLSIRSTSIRSLKRRESVASATHNTSRANSSSSDKENGPLRIRTQERSPGSPSAIVETPPESPRVLALQSGQNANHRRDSSFRKTYDENDKKRAIACENCALTLPKKTKDDTASNGSPDITGPILRTRKPYERVALPSPQTELSPPKSTTSSSSGSDSEATNHSTTFNPHRQSFTRVGTSSSNSSFTSTISHTHFLDYTSTHEPLAPASFSIIRQSCLRTLSCETLPPSSTQVTASTPSPFLNNSFYNGPSGGGMTTSSGGPIFFGDPLAGYTTAYIFRIPDPNARGRRRVYALMALSTHRERLAMQTFSFLSTAFRDLAAWIQGLAEAELERQENGERNDRSERGTIASIQSTPTSSFLSGRSRGGDGGKFAGMNLRARGLAELVGLPDFFIELHARFVRLLIELGMLLGI